MIIQHDFPGIKGDIYDAVKWDFDEHDIPAFLIENIPYKAQNINNAYMLATIRKKINQFAYNIFMNKKKWPHNMINKIELFLNTDFLLSEIRRGTKFDGLNKPKFRFYDTNSPNIGKDGQMRASYRDIFLNLGVANLDKLIIHELAHSFCNHVQYREDDHGEDFVEAEKFIKLYW